MSVPTWPACFLDQVKCHEMITKKWYDFLIVIGEKPTGGVTFRKHGAIHKARWMAVAIYGVKMFLFCEQLQYSEHQCDKLPRFVQFITLFYALSWMK
jgi:hypothetical protein